MNNIRSTGIKWGPFTLRIPFIHVSLRWGEFLQGMVISGATAFAAAPLAMKLGLTFEEAVAVSFVAGSLISAGPLIFGEPMAPGWVTPAVPIVIGALASAGMYGVEPCIDNVCTYNPDTFRYLAAMCIEFTILILLLGLTGFGKVLVEMIPRGLKAGIILGAALAAFYQVFFEDFETYMLQPISMTVAITLCVITTFSNPYKALASKSKFFTIVGSLGLLPGFLIAGLVAYWTNELQFNIEWGFKIPEIMSLIEKTSPFYIGFPDMQMFIDAAPLVLIGYMLLFGDLVTGTEVLKDAQKNRPDEILPIDLNRSHLSVGIRNLIATCVNPFFSNPRRPMDWCSCGDSRKMETRQRCYAIDFRRNWILLSNGNSISILCLTICNFNAAINGDGIDLNTDTNRICMCIYCYVYSKKEF